MNVEPVRSRFQVEGIVQGVGFRPFVHAVAHRLGLAGMVGNDGAGVFIEIEGPATLVAAFREALEREAPPLAVIERVSVRPLPLTGDRGFVITQSLRGARRRTLISPDVATCDDCLRELADPAGRRYRHPFINCTNCGPRFTIVRDVPYDRPFTTMAGFPMCARCATEYHDPSDRRFHAQPICCPDCGPTLRLHDPARRPLSGDPIATAARLLREGLIVAIKGLGGHHLATDAGNEQATARLRARKHREDRPFAVMTADLTTAERLCEVSGPARDLLTGPCRPIVLLPRRPGAPLAASVAPGNHDLGLVLPYTPVHHLLAAQVPTAVMTSGNVSDEPIAYTDDEAFGRLGGIADAFLTHDRPIHMRTDDSVIRVSAGRTTPVRRSRGFAPRPLTLPVTARREVLGCGAELKNTFCLATGPHAFVSHHIGDLENYQTLRSFTGGIEHFRRLFDISPQLVAHDLHPEYLSTKYALDQDEVELIAVQHHHAHIASCLADNGVDERVIGVAFDGLGFGTDGTLWGGEFLLADLRDFTRAGHLAPVPLPGGAAAVREPWRMAAAYLNAAGHDGLPLVAARQGARWGHIVGMARSGLNAPLTSSAGRLFDAVAAILGIRDTVNYEGQAAIELEQRTDPSIRDAYPVRISSGEPFLVHGTDLVQAVLADLDAGVPQPVIAGRFHNGVAAAIVAACLRLRAATGITVVALSGGVFQNQLLLERTIPALREGGLQVLTHRNLPPNDGGISLGQAAVAAARDHAAS